MSSKPKVSINVPDGLVQEVRTKMQDLAERLKELGADSSNQSQLYRAMALGGDVVQEGNDLYVKFRVGSFQPESGD
jgi:hypothetical protein